MGAEEGEEGAVSVLKRERLCVEGEGEEEESPNKKQAKEPSNDDIVSEISNPVSSPVENTSRFHPVKSGSGDFGFRSILAPRESRGSRLS
ncbi:BnaA04g21490D [Brassica napus]|uniref:BnaA04g21490D protein n=1 Tax=Brassica napus TaxID=3708 RepID=A0A078G1E0_BRANA|nr:BnaA04g21490D [Brassica napus]